MKRLFLVICITLILLSYVGLLTASADGRKPPESLPAQSNGCNGQNNPHCPPKVEPVQSPDVVQDPAPTDPPDEPKRSYHPTPIVSTPLPDREPETVTFVPSTPVVCEPITVIYRVPRTETALVPSNDLIDSWAVALELITIGAIAGLVLGAAIYNRR